MPVFSRNARLKILTCKPLPAEETEFFELVKAFFPCIYDIKCVTLACAGRHSNLRVNRYLMKSCKNLKGGLSDLAEDLSVCGCYALTAVNVLMGPSRRYLASDPSTRQVAIAC